MPPPGVPHCFAAVSLPPAADPAFFLPFAAIERWTREVWLTTATGRLRPPDVLTGQELAEVHRILCRGDREVCRGPGMALVDAMRRLGATWELPHVFNIGGDRIDCTARAPALVKKIAAQQWAAGRRAAAEATLRSR